MEDEVSVERAEPRADATQWRVPPRPELSEAEKRWMEENSEAIDAHNAWVREHGLPLRGRRRL